MSEPDVAQDYDERGVEAVRRVLIEIGQVLGTWREKIVIVGGAVPWLLLPNSQPAHIGTLDIDLALDPIELSDGEYVNLIQTLESKGYTRAEDGLRSFQMRRMVSVDTGPPIAVLIDFLMPKRARTKDNHPPLLAGFRVIGADGASVAIRHATSMHMEGQMVDGRYNRVDLQVATIPAFLVMKGFALDGRDKKKDAYDIYFAIRNFEGGIPALAVACQQLMNEAEARTGLQKIAGKFRNETDYGPETVRRFLSESSALGEMTSAQVRTDAYRQVSALMKALSLQ